MQKTLIRVIERKQLVQIIYLDTNHKITQRTVNPLEITNKYLKGYCYLRKQIRLFMLDQILAASPLSQTNRRLG